MIVLLAGTAVREYARLEGRLYVMLSALLTLQHHGWVVFLSKIVFSI